MDGKADQSVSFESVRDVKSAENHHQKKAAETPRPCSTQQKPWERLSPWHERRHKNERNAADEADGQRQ